MPWLEPVTLRGEHARLEPLSHDQRDGLIEAVKDGELWKLWYTFIPKAEDMAKEIDRRLGLQKSGSMLPFTVFDGRAGGQPGPLVGGRGGACGTGGARRASGQGPAGTVAQGRRCRPVPRWGCRATDWPHRRAGRSGDR